MALFRILDSRMILTNQTFISFVLEVLFFYCVITNRKTVKAWFALNIRDGVHTNFLRIRWLKFQHVDVVMASQIAREKSFWALM